MAILPLWNPGWLDSNVSAFFAGCDYQLSNVGHNLYTVSTVIPR